jgi:two-component system cell cycle response regulator DivK
MVVMVVDDVADTRDMYERYLAFRGMRVISAVDGDDAIHLMQMDRPDVIVLDLAMPRVTGWDVLRQIKGSDRTRAIPVIVLSGQNARDRALAAGADSYVEKPCVPENLMREILRVLRDPQRRQ